MPKPDVVVRKAKKGPSLQRTVAKFLVDRLLNDMEIAKELEDALAGEGNPNAMEQLFDSAFPELEGYPADMEEEDLRAFIAKHEIPDNYCDLDFGERSDRFHK